jgi:hypothetical protein
MGKKLKVAQGWALLVLMPIVGSGCLVAAAGAGAGGAIYVTSRGAESIVDAPVSRVAAAVDVTFADMGITETKSTSGHGGDEREIQGKRGDLDITVSFKRESPGTTRVEVTARENLAEWNKDYARQVLERIVQRS